MFAYQQKGALYRKLISLGYNVAHFECLRNFVGWVLALLSKS